MAFYFALLNVSKKDTDNRERSSHQHRRHRRHSIASVESPLLDYRLLPRPQLLSDDVVITNELAHQFEQSSSQIPASTLSRRCRGSARASKWVHENHSRPPDQPGPSRSQNAGAAPLSRSKRMAFGQKEHKEPEPERKKVGKAAKKGGGEEETNTKKTDRNHSDGRKEQKPLKKEPAAEGIVEREKEKEAAKKTRQRQPSLVCSSAVSGASGAQKPAEVPKPRTFQIMVGSATDESGRSSSQMSNESTTPRRDDSPASSCDEKVLEDTKNETETQEKEKEVVMKEAEDDDAEEERKEARRALTDNHNNQAIERGTRSILRRGLIRRRSTSDKTRLLAYRNTGFLSSSQERQSDSSTPPARMTVSVDRLKYK
ncbi:unnamed protein product [Caenorhabditis sp. 36 PRJEB53466]|nr:unnamed protein product [Caenorhabditis sp. 36 PRJEB53466]